MLHATVWMNPENIMLKKSDAKDLVYFHSICMKYPKREMFGDQNQISDSR